jgi:uncharacterized repeat protein (TIGR02543 family)
MAALLGFFPKYTFRRRFMKKTVFLGLLTILLAFGFIGCENGTTTYSVTFNSNGGSNVSTITGIESGATITLPNDPTKENYEFAGWFIDNTTFEVEFTSLTVITSNLVVFAKWVEMGGGFTLINIPSEYNGKYAFIIVAENDDIQLAGAQNIDEDGILTSIQISNQRVSIPMILFNDDDSLENYSGNDTVELWLVIAGSPTFFDGSEHDNQLIIGWYFESVAFSDGKAIESWDDGEEFSLSFDDIENGFTLIDIPSEYNGKYAFIIEASNNEILLIGTQSLDLDTGEFSLINISNEEVFIPMFKVIDDDTLESYSGSDIVEVYLVITNLPNFSFGQYGEEDENQIIIYWYFESVSFLNGIAIKSWDDGEEIIF